MEYMECSEAILKLVKSGRACRIVLMSIQMSESTKPTVYVIAGPNGAGKTTFANHYLPAFAGCEEFVNADLIAAGLSPFNPESQAAYAGQLMLERIDRLTKTRTSFGFETTLAGRAHAVRLKSMKEDFGYRVSLFFIWLPSAEQAIARVANRVREGGHNVPESTIRRRYALGIKNFVSLYLPALDEWFVYNGCERPAEIILGQQDGVRQVYNDDLLVELKRIAPELVP
jgi:predicted ABC-type ATPase